MKRMDERETQKKLKAILSSDCKKKNENVMIVGQNFFD